MKTSLKIAFYLTMLAGFYGAYMLWEPQQSLSAWSWLMPPFKVAEEVMILGLIILALAASMGLWLSDALKQIGADTPLSGVYPEALKSEIAVWVREWIESHTEEELDRFQSQMSRSYGRVLITGVVVTVACAAVSVTDTVPGFMLLLEFTCGAILAVLFVGIKVIAEILRDKQQQARTACN